MVWILTSIALKERRIVILITLPAHHTHARRLRHGRRVAHQVRIRTVVVRLDQPPAAGDSLTVEVVLTMRLLYMQIAPQRYVTNRVPVAREVVLA